MLARAMFGRLSPAGAGARLSTLIFHRVLGEPDLLFPGEVHARQFDQMCTWLKQWFNVLPLDEAATRLTNGSLPARALAITFDDGYADNHDVALPILQRHGLQATFFIATGFLDGGRMWNDSIIETIRGCTNSSIDLSGFDLTGIERLDLVSLAQRKQAIERLIGAIKYLPVRRRLQLCQEIARRAGVELPENMMMSSSQVVALCRAGMQIGAHTVTHPILANLDVDVAISEIAEGKQQLECLVGEDVSVFAYPNGRPGMDYNEGNVAAVQALGFKAAVSTTWGVACQSTNPFQIPRFTPWDRSRARFGARLLHNMWPR